MFALHYYIFCKFFVDCLNIFDLYNRVLCIQLMFVIFILFYFLVSLKNFAHIK